MTDYDCTVRTTAVSIVGQIGLPEGIITLESLMRMIKNEKEVDVKSKAIWVVGRLANGCEDEV